MVAVAVLFVASQLELYAVQPIGALPQGITLIVWRHGQEPFFNSPDAMSLKATGGVSLLSRGLALGAAPVDRVILRLPYIEAAYLLSTGGKQFDR
jgi:hypothetical protein